MPGVNPPPSDALPAFLGDLSRRLRALETQQQTTITNTQGQPVINFGLVPGSSPPRFGLQFVDPASGAELVFLGEGASGAVFDLSGTLTMSGTETVTGTLNVSGTETVTGALNVSGTETVSGTLDVTGNTIIGGTLSLPNGIINNAALADPVTAGSCDVSATGLNGSGTAVVVASSTIAVPSGFSRAAVIGVVQAAAVCTSGSASILYDACHINGVAGPTANTLIAAGFGNEVTAAFATVLTGLSGGNITVESWGWESQPAYIVAGTVGGHVSALATFMR